MEPARDYADLEIRILELGDEGYPVEITFSGEQEFPRGYLDRDVVRAIGRRKYAGRDDEKGEALFAMLFRDERLRRAWAEARGLSRLRRLRLRIDDSAPELHAVPWEVLRDAEAGAAARTLAAGSDTPFSRYLAGTWRPGSPVLERPVRLLAAIADPEDLDDYGLARLDTEEQRRALEAALGDSSEVALDVLDAPVTLRALEDELKKGYHVLHLVAHGRFNPSPHPSILYLEDTERRAAPVTESELAEMLVRQDGIPRLVFLASCQSAERGTDDAFRGFAPRLVAAGVPAVLAMQGQIPVATATELASTFYRRLFEHGLVDLACNEARSVLLSAKLPGASRPVLFMRLRDARLFGRRGSILGKRESGFWSTLLDNVADQECTPLLGPGVTAGLLPDPGQLARRLAREHDYPFADGDRLSRVAQYVGTIDNRNLRKKLVRLSTFGFLRRIGRVPGREDRRAGLSRTIAAADWSRLIRELDEVEIHHQLADLELPLYLTTNFDNFLTLALESKGREVRRLAVDWRGTGPDAGTSAPGDFEPPASTERPVVLHLHGTDENLLSMVLTEDDHLDYLTRIARDHEYLLPASVSEALARNTLLFLGYRLDDLNLKVILRGVLAHLDLSRWSRYHVAVQVDESEDAGQEDVSAYFRKYFGKSQIDVYWGTTRQFVTELHERWAVYQG